MPSVYAVPASAAAEAINLNLICSKVKPLDAMSSGATYAESRAVCAILHRKLKIIVNAYCGSHES